eukprot:GGOE01057064.1.p1 GENE.GGOE01057064.1~~GGOE01057064.1.p1  ORF type:complete len:479 (+),score=111.74 GGOE01057064.1:53-1489(+)
MGHFPLLFLLVFAALGAGWSTVPIPRLQSLPADVVPPSQRCLPQGRCRWKGSTRDSVQLIYIADRMAHLSVANGAFAVRRNEPQMSQFLTYVAAAMTTSAVVFLARSWGHLSASTQQWSTFSACAMKAQDDEPLNTLPKRVPVARREVNGILVLDKPTGFTSNSVLQKLKFIYRAAKAGHSGTLDPLATGMLPICFGRATKLAQILTDSDKTYIVKAKLGERTDTQDQSGQVIARRPVELTLAMVEQALEQFRGEIQQVPPMFSALKRDGVPLYRYAFRGVEVPREARPVTVYDLKLLEVHLQKGEDAFLRLQVHCSKGFYVRTLVDDLGEVLGCGAFVQELRRTTFTSYLADQLVTLDQILSISDGSAADISTLEALDRLLLPMEAAVPLMPELTVTSWEANRLARGAQIRPKELQALRNATGLPVLLDQPVKLMENGTVFFAVGQFNGQPVKLKSTTILLVPNLPANGSTRPRLQC